jgi:hypothetical protein
MEYVRHYYYGEDEFQLAEVFYTPKRAKQSDKDWDILFAYREERMVRLDLRTPKNGKPHI